MSAEYHEYIVIGAGIAGLTAAQILQENGEDYVVLQAQSHVGGRICGLRIGEVMEELQDAYQEAAPKWMHSGQEESISLRPELKSLRFETGAAWISEEHTMMLHLVRNFRLNIFRQYTDGLKYYAASPSHYIPLDQIAHHYRQYKPHILPFIRLVEQLKFTVKKLEHSLIEQEKILYAKYVATYDHMTVQEFMERNITDPEARAVVINDYETLECVSCKQAGVMNLIQDTESLELVYFYCEQVDENIDGFRMAGGLLSILEAIVKKITSLRNSCGSTTPFLKLNSAVTHINNSMDDLTTITLASGQQLRCRRVFLSVPIAIIHRIHFSEISTPKSILFNSQLPGEITRYYCVYENAFWRGRYSGYVNFSNKFYCCELTDFCSVGLECGVLAFIFTKGRYWEWVQQLHKDQGSGAPSYDSATRSHLLPPHIRAAQRQYINKLIADLYLQGDASHPLLASSVHFARTVCTNEFIVAAYQAVLKPGAVHKTIEGYEGNPHKELIRDEGSVAFIGTEFAEEFNTYMEGAVRRARFKVHEALGKQDPLRHLL